MRRLLLLTPAIACALTLTAAGLSAKPTGQLVFASSGQITLADVSDGRELRLDEPGDVVDVTVSPDGTHLAYQTASTNSFSLYVADRSGRNRWPLDTSEGYVTAPVWSPDGTQVAWDDAGAIWVARVKGRRRQPLSDITRGTSFAWSPDGSMLAYGTFRGMLLVDAKTHAQRALLPKASVLDVAWTPDGRNIVYADDNSNALYVVNVFGKTHRRRFVVGQASVFTLSPDGRTVAYESHYAGLYTVPLAGGRPRLVASSFFDYAWSPDSNTLAFSRPANRRGVVPAIYLIPARGGVPRRLLTSIGDDGARWPSWSPDSRRIAYQRIKKGFQSGRWYVVDADGTHNQPVAPDDPEAVPEDRPLSWLTRPVVLPAPPPTTTLHPAARTRTNTAVAGLAVDGEQALAVSGRCCDADGLGSWQAALWSPGGGPVYSPANGGSLCPEHLNSFTVAASRFAYTCESYDGVDPPELDVHTGTTEQPNQTGSTLTSSSGEVSVAGGGQLLVATVDSQLLRLNSDGSSTPLRTYPQGSFPLALAVDQNRVLVELNAGSGEVLNSDRLEVVSADGAVVAGFAAAHDGGALLRGSQVFIVHDGVLAVRDFAGQVQSTRHLPKDPELEDVSGSLVLYSAASRLHLLRVSDGKDITLRIPGQFLHAWARFADDGGIFYGYNTFAAQGYWIAYVPAGIMSALRG
jgi:Tol biopolymer transport system component